MPARKGMSRESRLEYLTVMQGRYHKASRKERSLLLDEMEQVTGCIARVSSS